MKWIGFFLSLLALLFAFLMWLALIVDLHLLSYVCRYAYEYLAESNNAGMLMSTWLQLCHTYSAHMLTHALGRISPCIDLILQPWVFQIAYAYEYIA